MLTANIKLLECEKLSTLSQFFANKLSKDISSDTGSPESSITISTAVRISLISLMTFQLVPAEVQNLQAY